MHYYSFPLLSSELTFPWRLDFCFLDHWLFPHPPVFRTKAISRFVGFVPSAVDWLATVTLGHGVWLAAQWLTEVEIPLELRHLTIM